MMMVMMTMKMTIRMVMMMMMTCLNRAMANVTPEGLVPRYRLRVNDQAR
jgi:hypothetical protein